MDYSCTQKKNKKKSKLITLKARLNVHLTFKAGSRKESQIYCDTCQIQVIDYFSLHSKENMFVIEYYLPVHYKMIRC